MNPKRYTNNSPKRSDLVAEIGQKSDLLNELLNSLEGELDTPDFRLQVRGSLKNKALTNKQVENLLVDYTVLSGKIKLVSQIFPEILILFQQLRKLNKLVDKGGRPEKKESQLGVDIAIAHYEKHGKHISAEQLSIKVSLLIRGVDNGCEDKDGVRPLSASGARNCINRAKQILNAKSNQQILLIDLLRSRQG
jgi:hypothetical protein